MDINFILASIGIFLAVILLLVAVLLIAKTSHSKWKSYYHRQR